MRINTDNADLITVFPNPAHNEKVSVRINQEIDQNGILNLYNQSGQQLSSKSLDGMPANEVIQLSDFPLSSGWYIVSIKTPFESKKIKLVIQ